jgi:inner membrane transporter RhtA
MLGAIVSLCVGSSFAKTLFPALGATGTTAIRVAVAATLLVAIWRPWRFPLTREGVRAIVPYGVVLGCMNLAFYLAIARIPVGVAIAIEFTGPLALAAASARRKLDFVWIAFAVLGLALLLPGQAGVAPLDPVGVAFALVAAVCWALYIVTGQRAGGLHGGQATSLGMLVAALVVVPAGLGPASAALADPRLLLTGLGVGLLSSAVPYSLEMIALKRLTKTTFGVMLSLEPAVGALAGLVVLGEALTPLQWTAIGSVIVASAGSARGIAPPPGGPARPEEEPA